jgi:hypothetical protein
MAERYWQELRPSDAGRFRLDATLRPDRDRKGAAPLPAPASCPAADHHPVANPAVGSRSLAVARPLHGRARRRSTAPPIRSTVAPSRSAVALVARPPGLSSGQHGGLIRPAESLHGGQGPELQPVGFHGAGRSLHKHHCHLA